MPNGTTFSNLDPVTAVASTDQIAVFRADPKNPGKTIGVRTQVGQAFAAGAFGTLPAGSLVGNPGTTAAAAGTIVMGSGLALSAGGLLTNAGVLTLNGRAGAVSVVTSDVTNALGYTPAPISIVGTGLNLSGGTLANAGVVAFNGRAGSIALSSGDVLTALTYTPANRAGDTYTGRMALASGGYFAGNSGTCSAAGVTQGTATRLPNQETFVTAGTAGQGVLVPLTAPGGASLIGVWQEIMNRSGVDLLMWPDTGAQLETAGTNTAVPCLNGSTYRVKYVSSTQGYIA